MFWLLVATSSALAQTTGFTYQGRLTDGGTAANGNYDLQFVLWDSLTNGTQVGSAQTINTVAVSNGVFTVSLDFGENAFPGASRFLEISARPSGAGSFTLLTPRQPITSTPYAVRSLGASSADTANNATQLGGVAANQYVQTNDSRLSDSRPPTPGSSNYIQNSSSPQTANFNISGSGTAAGTLSSSVVNATTQYNLNGSRILSNAGTENLFAGTDAGAANTTGFRNSFFGYEAGAEDTGSANAFFGSLAGRRNTTGGGNAFFGYLAGFNNTTGSSNTLIGALAITGTNNLTNASAIGALAQVDASNSLVLGSISGVQGAAADTNVGIGTTAPTRLLHLQGLGSNGLGFSDLLVTGTGTVGAGITLQSTGSAGRTYSWLSTASGASAGGGKLAAFDVTAGAYRMVIDSTGRVGIGTTAPDQLLTVNGNASKFSGGTSWAVFSDERLKNIKGQFTPGLKALLQLQPIRFEYKRDNTLGLHSGEEVGFSAQAVEKVLPEAVSRSQQGYLQLHSDPILWTMLNAIKEQQAQIEMQRQQIVGLKKLVCRSHARAAVCK